MSNSIIPIVIDTGTQEWRAGFANEPFPGVTLVPSLQSLEGSEVVENGIVLEFKGSHKAIAYYTKHIQDCLTGLKVESKSAHLLLAVPQKMSDTYRKRLTEVLFEDFDFQSVFYVSQPLLAAYSSGYSNCLVVDSGYSHTGILAVKNLNPLGESERVLPFGGRNIDRYLRHLSGNKLAAYNEADLRHIKVNYCSVASSFPKSSDNARTVVTMPDGNKIAFGEELILAPEMLFNPSLGGLADVMPIDQAAIRSALSLEENDAYTVLETVVLAGGNTAFPGTASRMQVGIATRTVPRINKRVIKHRQGIEAVWMGGTIIASTQTYPKICITKEAYKERGSTVAIDRWL
ncbi:actin [Taenia solium]|eukprot:TsM_000575100 transcript=TsM_000575100 gene=TsM_000575100